MSKRNYTNWFLALGLLFSLTLAACGGSADLEQAVQEAAEQVEEAAQQAQEAIEETAVEVQEAVEEEMAEEEMAEEETVEEETVAEETMAEPDYDTAVYGNIDEIDLSGATVVFWHQHSGGREQELLQIVEDFNASNEYGITVEARNEGGYGDIYDKMIAGLTTGELPGLVVAYQNQAAAYEVADGLVNMQPYIDHPVYGIPADELSDFFQAFIEADRLPQFNNEQYGFPPNRSMEMLYYNAEWLAELYDAGAISFEGPPQTPDQFAEAVCAAAENPFSKNPDPSFSVGYEVRTDASNVASMAFARGVDIYDDEANQFTYNTPELAEYMTLMADLLAQGCAGEIAEAFGDQTDFGNGKTLFTMGSSSGLPFYKSAVDDGEAGGFEWSVAAVPHTTPDPVMNIYGASVSIPKTDPATQLAAWVFIKYYTSSDIQARWARASNYFPVRESVASGLDEYFAENPAFEVAFNLLPYTKSEPGVAGYDPIRDAASSAFSRVLQGEDAATVLAELDATANSLLAESAP